MVKLTSPYNFVPLNKRVYVPSWYNEVFQDIPFEDGENGWIEVTWKNVSPLIIKEGADKGDSGNKIAVPVHVKEDDGKKRYFIPGTSMKGMLRSTLEILSFGKMEQYDDRFFGHREFDTKKTDGKAYQAEMQNVRWGWLRKDDDDLFLSPCDKDVEKILVLELEHEYSGLDTKTSQWERNEYIAKKSGQGMFPKRGSYRLYCTGKMHNKKHEYLIPAPAGEEEKLSKETRDEFLTVHGPTPGFEKFIDLLDKGEMIPVSYIRKNGEIVAVGLSRMLRNPYKQNVRMLVEKEQKPVEGKDLCETIFGFIGKTSKDTSLRGRVQVSHAFCTHAPDGEEILLDEESGVLGEPKPSFYPLYLKQPGPQYKTFNNADGIAGRKLYRVHAGSGVLPLPQGNDNDNTKSYFRPLKAGLTFVMRINLHNMRPVEIGAVLSALTLHDTKGAWHNMGSGKSFGYGKIECVDVKLKSLKLLKEDYMRIFEKEMENFTKEWRETEQAKMLVNILSEHSDDDVRMMTLKEYGDVSKNDSFQRLVEGKRGLTSLFDKKYWKRKFREENNDEYVKAEKLREEGKLTDAISIYVGLISELISKELSTDEEEKNVEEIKAEIRKRFREELRDECEKAEKLKEEGELTDAINIYNGLMLKLPKIGLSTGEEKKIRDDLHDRITKLRLAMGLKALLEEKYPDGRYKWDTVKKALDVTDNRWLKKANRKELTEQEKEDLLSKLKRLKSDQNKADKRMWSNPEDKTWKCIERMIGKELMDELRAYRGAPASLISLDAG